MLSGRGDEGLGAQPLQGLLEVGDVGGPQVDQGVGLAGDGVGADHLGVPAGRGGDLGRRGAAGAEQFDERLGGPADRGRVDDRGESLDHPGRSQPVHPPLDRRRGERHDLPDVGERGPRVGRQRRNDSLVCVVKVQRIASRSPGKRL